MYSVQRTAFFHVPRGHIPEGADLAHYIRTFAATQERAGFTLDRVLRVYKTPEPVLRDDGRFYDEYNIVGVLTREQLTTVKLDLPDRDIKFLLEHYPRKFTERMVS